MSDTFGPNANSAVLVYRFRSARTACSATGGAYSPWTCRNSRKIRNAGALARSAQGRRPRTGDRPVSFPRQRKPERRAVDAVRFHPNTSTIQLDNALADGQSDSGARV